MAARLTTAQWMRDRGYEKVWKSALGSPEERRRFKFARATVERIGVKDIPKKAADLEARAKQLREDLAFYEEALKKLDGMKSVMKDWGKGGVK